MMNRELLKKIINTNEFIVEEKACVDGEMNVLIRPLYVERLYLDYELTKELADDISLTLLNEGYEVVYAIEASILPLAALIAERLKCSLSIIRKPNNYHHEENEPSVFVRKDLIQRKSILIDDAIWSGFTMNHALKLAQEIGAYINDFYFVFDFLSYQGGKKLSVDSKEKIKNYKSWIHYKDVVEMAHLEKLISSETYYNTMKLFDPD